MSSGPPLDVYTSKFYTFGSGFRKSVARMPRSVAGVVAATYVGVNIYWWNNQPLYKYQREQERLAMEGKQS
eukprot:CAMPEP_0205819426 /NCGR_PEP_ID=MMETSP0206-20130828/1799_1 /ASSEMBLY_ACC=CAM_ASM_000279 /TAXON_ID=36767 /ORGANISM="Euplotes focardii, Strain TN1" /LENGTH=70 /DNA_ID=CAMNT_0053113019 /DNA_START=35 /DNA_END=247 /DNA_ORIENTATION=+